MHSADCFHRSASATFTIDSGTASTSTGNTNDGGVKHGGLHTVTSPSGDRRRRVTERDSVVSTNHGTLICTPHHGSSVTFCNAAGIGQLTASGQAPSPIIRRGGSHSTERPSTISFDHSGRCLGVGGLVFETRQNPLLRRSCSSSTLTVCLPEGPVAASAPTSPSVSITSRSPTMTATTTADGSDRVSMAAAATVSESGNETKVERQYFGNTMPLPVITCDGVSSSLSSNQSTTVTESQQMAAFSPSPLSSHRRPTPVATSRAALLLAPPLAVVGSTVTGSCGGRAAGCAVSVGGSTCSKTVLVTPYGSFLSVNQPPAEFRESTLSIGGASSTGYTNYADDGEEMSLVYTRIEKIPMKDFAAEIRAHLDVEHFLSQAQLMLDWPIDATAEQVLDQMLHHLLDTEEPPTAYQDASKVLFTHKSVHQLSKTIQSTSAGYGSGLYDYDQSWVCVLCTAASVQKRHVAIARLRSPAYIGRTCQEVWFIILVVTSTKEKGTKNVLETGRTFATLFADTDLRIRLLGARSETEFKRLMWEHMKELADEQHYGSLGHHRQGSESSSDVKDEELPNSSQPGPRVCWFARGLRADWTRRIPHYFSDYKDGFVGPNTMLKTISTTFFLYFACILPAIALGVLNYNNTGGQIDVKKTIYSQTISGLVFAIFGGQPMVILLTTAPLALYTKVIYNICEEWGLDFLSMFACTGLWNSFFLLIYAFTDASNLMKWCTRSTEEIFALFISIAFAVDAFKDVACDFHVNYFSSNCRSSPSIVTSPSSTFAFDPNATLSGASASMTTSSVHHLPYSHSTSASTSVDVGSQSAGVGYAAGSGSKSYGVCSLVSALSHGDCRRENSLLYLLLMLGTVWLGLSLYNFTKTPFLNQGKRELLADCALPVSVLTMSLFGSYVFQDINLNKFKVLHGEIFKPAPLSNLEWPAILGAMGLGFCLSLLIFMDQNIAGAMVNSPDYRMKKGPAHHWDLMIVAVLNAVLAVFGLPMVHGALPHSPLHVRAMADVEDRVLQGHVYLKIVSVRETRVTGILSHVLIGLSVLFIEQLKLIPRPVLDGLFLYLAVTALHSNQLFERIMLLVTEQTAYPPNHYIRAVPQRKIHLFTFIQLLQLAVLCGVGFAPIPYLKMVFPVLHLVMLPIRHKLVPHVVDKKYLHSLDGH